MIAHLSRPRGFSFAALLVIVALLLLLHGQAGAAAPVQQQASLISLNRLLYDPNFPAYATQGWLLKRTSPLATLDSDADLASSPGALIGLAAARDGINPKVLLTWLELRGALDSTSPSFGLDADATFSAQVNKATKLLREGLLPQELGRAFTLDGGAQSVNAPFEDPGSYALSRALAASLTAPTWERATSSGEYSFVATYMRLFGEDPRDPILLAPSAAPFLTTPFRAGFEHRSYFDHTYPTVDYGSDGNPAMTSYDGVIGRLYDSHDGHDYEFPIGTPIYAAAAGTAYFLRSNDCGDPNSLGVLIRHSDGYETIYWHMSTLVGSPATNRAVARGEFLGNSGQTGCANRPHLHFEVRHNGLESDPYGWSGVGADPCPGRAGSNGYRGCEASTYLWLQAPDSSVVPATPQPTNTPLPPPTATRPPSTPVPSRYGLYLSRDVPQALPPSGSTGTARSRLTIENGPSISNIRVVGLNFDHTYAADLDVFLISPAGTRVELFSDLCGSGSWAGGTNFTLDDGASSIVGAICPPGSGIYKPEGSLAALVGQQSSGVWTLEVADDAEYDTGTLKSWGLELNSGCAISFSDVLATDYFYEPVRSLFCRGIISGYNDGTFRPYAQVTRAQLLKMVALAEGWSLTAPATPSFSDVARGEWFYSYVETAYARGVVAGYTDDTFRPQNSVNRGQLAKIIVAGAGWFLATPATATFSDVPPGSTYFPFVETAALRGVLSGYADRTFRPYLPAIRAQITKTIFTRLQ